MRAFRVTIPEQDEDAATAALWEAGTAGVEVRRADGTRRSRAWAGPDAPQATLPGQLELIAYFPAATTLEALSGLPPSAQIEPSEVPQVDWVERFREGFVAFRAGRFHVVPVWDADRYRREVAPPARDLLLVDPGRAFGTGTHETTRLCLRALEELSARRRLGRTLDLGAGSGLLAVAAARLGAGPVLASDIDPDALDSTRRHAGLNTVPLLPVRADGGRGFAAESFDLVLANLMALLLMDRAQEVRALLRPGGALVLSGLLIEDVPAVAKAFASSGHARQLQDGEWAALVFEAVP